MGEGLQVEGFEQESGAAVAFQFGAVGQGEEEILAQGEVGEKGVALEDVAAVALLGREGDLGGGVDEEAIVEQDAAFGRLGEAGD
jgi:hypothetical protein